MSAGGNLNKALAIAVAIAVFFQTAIFGMVLCIHADGTQRIEDFAKQAACHASQQVAESHGAGRSLIASNSCIDRVLSMEAVASRTDSLDSIRLTLSPALIALLHWVIPLQTSELTQRSAVAYWFRAFPSDQHTRILSSTVILI